MGTTNITEAKAQLSSPFEKLVPFERPSRPRQPGAPCERLTIVTRDRSIPAYPAPTLEA